MKKYVVLFFIVLAAFLWGCSSDGGDSGGSSNPPPIEGTHVLTEENRVVKEGDVTIIMPISAIGEKAELTVKKTTATTPIMGVEQKGTMLDISMGSQHDINGTVEIKVPYKVGDASSQLAVGYYNESTKEWESVDWEYTNGNVVINSDHFSRYGIFEIKYENTASANFVSFCETTSLFGNEVFLTTLPMQAFVKLSQCDGKTSKVLDTLADVYGTGNQFVNDLGYASVKALGFNTAIDGWMDKYGQNFSYVGFAFTMWQVSRQVHEGKNKEAFASIIDAASTNSIGILGGIFGASFGVVGLSAYLATKYVINSFFTGVITGRKDEYVQAYNLYIKENGRYYKDWYNLIYPIVTNEDYNDAEKSEAIDKLVTDYCYAFWKDYTMVCAYYEEATGKSMGAGMADTEVYKNMQKEISENRRGEIYNNTIPQIMTEINGKMRAQNFNTFKKHFMNFRDMLNKPFTLNFVDADAKEGKSKLEGYKVKFSELPKSIEDSKNWECTLDKDGKGSIKLTVFAYLKNKMKAEMILVDKNGKTVKKVEFTPNPPTNTITFNGSEIQEPEDADIANFKKELVGDWLYNEYFDEDEIYSYNALNTINTTIVSVRFNADGTYQEIESAGLRDNACLNLSCTRQKTNGVTNAGKYTVYKDTQRDLLHIKFESTMSDKNLFGQTISDYIVPNDLEKVSNPVLRKNYVHQCTVTKLSLSTISLYKGIWNLKEIKPKLPSRIGVLASCNCRFKGNETYSSGKTDQFVKDVYHSLSFDAENIVMSKNGDDCQIVATNAEKGAVLTFTLALKQDETGIYTYYLTNYNLDIQNNDTQKWVVENLDAKLNSSGVVKNLMFKSAKEDGMSMYCTYSKDGEPSYAGSLDPDKDYGLSIIIDAE